MVATMIGPSALGDDQEIMEPVYVEKVSQEFKDLIGYDSGYILTHFDNGVRFYCKVDDISDQLKTELVNYGVGF